MKVVERATRIEYAAKMKQNFLAKCKEFDVNLSKEDQEKVNLLMRGDNIECKDREEYDKVLYKMLNISKDEILKTLRLMRVIKMKVWDAESNFEYANRIMTIFLDSCREFDVPLSEEDNTKLRGFFHGNNIHIKNQDEYYEGLNRMLKASKDEVLETLQIVRMMELVEEEKDDDDSTVSSDASSINYDSSEDDHSVAPQNKERVARECDELDNWFISYVQESRGYTMTENQINNMKNGALPMKLAIEENGLEAVKEITKVVIDDPNIMENFLPLMYLLDRNKEPPNKIFEQEMESFKKELGDLKGEIAEKM